MVASLLLLALVILAIVAFVATTRKGARERASDLSEAMDGVSRALYVPIRRLASEIEELVDRGDSVAMRVIGKEAVHEATRIRDQCAAALVARTELRRASRGKSTVISQIEGLQKQTGQASSEREKEAFSGAQQAYKRQVEHFQKAEEAIGHIDVSIKEAEAVLAEMKTRLAVASGSEKAEMADSDDLRETIGRMKTLSVSYDEAQQTLGQQ